MKHQHTHSVLMITLEETLMFVRNLNLISPMLMVFGSTSIMDILIQNRKLTQFSIMTTLSKLPLTPH